MFMTAFMTGNLISYAHTAAAKKCRFKLCFSSNPFSLQRSKIHTNSTKCQRERRASCQVPLTRDHSGASANILQTKNKRTNTLQKTKVSIKIVNDRAHFICNKVRDALLQNLSFHLKKSKF